MAGEHESEDARTRARRRFLTTCGALAAATPPVITLMLTQVDRNYAIAASGTTNGPPPCLPPKCGR